LGSTQENPHLGFILSNLIKTFSHMNSWAIVKKLQLSLIYVLQSMSRLQNVVCGITSHFDKWISQKSDFELLWMFYYHKWNSCTFVDVGIS
jgi:hypothetical protein